MKQIKMLTAITVFHCACFNASAQSDTTENGDVSDSVYTSLSAGPLLDGGCALTPSNTLKAGAVAYGGGSIGVSHTTEKKILFYAHPQTSQFVIKSASKVLAISDMRGNNLINNTNITIGNDSLIISTKALPSGIYIVMWISKNGDIYLEKILKAQQ